MNNCQQLEMKRFTPNMWMLLHYARKMHPRPADIGGAWTRTARILERRGFLTINVSGRPLRSISLTDAGREATTAARRAVRATYAPWHTGRQPATP